MLGVGVRFGLRRAALGVAIIIMAAGTAGCAGGSYAGIPLAADAADPELQQLARRAQTGDKQAQLELGIRYEEGRGVLRDLDRAERLYRGAAAASGGRTWVYSPSVRKGGSGRAIPVDRGPRQPGLAEAARRLAALRNGRARP